MPLKCPRQMASIRHLLRTIRGGGCRRGEKYISIESFQDPRFRIRSVVCAKAASGCPVSAQASVRPGIHCPCSGRSGKCSMKAPGHGGMPVANPCEMSIAEQHPDHCLRRVRGPRTGPWRNGSAVSVEVKKGKCVFSSDGEQSGEMSMGSRWRIGGPHKGVVPLERGPGGRAKMVGGEGRSRQLRDAGVFRPEAGCER